MSNITPIKQSTAVAAALPNVSAMKLVAILAAELPPKLADGTTLAEWMERTDSVIGQHPNVVLGEAIDSITSTFRFAPTKAEIIDHILEAYRRLQLPLSDAAKRHLSFRTKLADRYTLNTEGVKRYADDTKVTLIGYFTVQGPQANLILDKVPGSIVEDFEKSIEPVAQAFAGKEKVAGADVLERFRTQVKIQAAYRQHGEPAEHCGGPVAVLPAGSKMLPVTSVWVALSESFVNRMRDAYPYARLRNNPTSWADALKDAFWKSVLNLDFSRYGQGLQQDAEAKIEAMMADLNREGRIELERAAEIDLRECTTNLTAITVAEQRLKAGEAVIDRISINGRYFNLHSQEQCEIARRRLETFTGQVEAKVAEFK